MTEEQIKQYHEKVDENIRTYGCHSTFVFYGDTPIIDRPMFAPTGGYIAECLTRPLFDLLEHTIRMNLYLGSSLNLD